MNKGWLLLIAMAFFATLGLVAAGADGMHFLLGFDQIGRFVQVVTIAAVLFLMAVDTTQAK